MRRNITVDEVKNSDFREVMLRSGCSYDAARRRWKKYKNGLIDEQTLYARNIRLAAKDARSREAERQAELLKNQNIVEHPTELIQQVMQVVGCNYRTARLRVRAYEKKEITWNDVFRAKGELTETARQEMLQSSVRVEPVKPDQVEEQTDNKQQAVLPKSKENIHLFENRQILDRFTIINGKTVNTSKLIRDIKNQIGVSYETARMRVKRYETGLLKEEELFLPKDAYKGHRYEQSKESQKPPSPSTTSVSVQKPKDSTSYREPSHLNLSNISVSKLTETEQNDSTQSSDKLKSIIDSLNLKDSAKIWVSHCPVTCGKTTKMTKESFRRICELKHDSRIREKSLVKYTRCEYCKKNEEFWPPELEIIDIQQYVSKTT